MSRTERPSPSAQGTLERRPLAHLLAYCYERRLTGSLVFGHPESPVGAIVLVSGEPTKASAQGSSGAWGNLADLPAYTAFSYFEGHDALWEHPEAPLRALAAIMSVLRRRPPVEHMKSVLDRVGQQDVTLVFDARVEGVGEAQAPVLERLRAEPFSLEQFRAEPAIGAEAEIILYALLITKTAQLVVGSQSQIPADPDSSEKLTAATASDSGIPPEPSSSQDAVPDSSDKPAAAKVGRVKLTRTTKPSLREERAVISSFDGRASFPPSAETESRRREILERARKIDTQNYFQMLGVDPATPRAQVQAAFLALAKRWHPDRLPPELADARDACARVFARMSEASATLNDEEQRQRYLKLLDEGGATPEDQEKIVSVVEAATNFQKAEVMLKRGDLVRAREFCSVAAKADPQPDYIALLAWIDAQDPKRQTPDDLRSFEAQLTTAIDKNDRCERAFFYRGNVRKKLGDLGPAIGDFRRAFELNPRNLDAQREVRLYEMRAQKDEAKRLSDSKPPPKPSIIGRLFKK